MECIKSRCGKSKKLQFGLKVGLVEASIPHLLLLVLQRPDVLIWTSRPGKTIGTILMVPKSLVHLTLSLVVTVIVNTTTSTELEFGRLLEPTVLQESTLLPS